MCTAFNSIGHEHIAISTIGNLSSRHIYFLFAVALAAVILWAYQAHYQIDEQMLLFFFVSSSVGRTKRQNKSKKFGIHSLVGQIMSQSFHEQTSSHGTEWWRERNLINIEMESLPFLLSRSRCFSLSLIHFCTNDWEVFFVRLFYVIFD